MTTQTEALKLALEALKIAFDQTCSVGRPKDWQQIHEAIAAIKEALAQKNGCCENPSQCWEPCGELGNSEEHVKVHQEQQKPFCTSIPQLQTFTGENPFPKEPEQKPVAVVDLKNANYVRWLEGVTYPVEGMNLYTTTPQRTWVGLTDEEREQVYKIWRFHPSNETNLHLCKAIEAKLKEKNT